MTDPVKARYLPSYWWANAMILALCVYSIARGAWGMVSASSQTLMNDLYEVAWIILMILMMVIYLVYLLMRHIREICIDGEQLVIKRALGAPLKVDLKDVTLINDTLKIKKLFAIQLSQMDNKEQIKDFLARNVKVIKDDPAANREFLLRVALILVFTAVVVYFLFFL